jgi:hypothetical protein
MASQQAPVRRGTTPLAGASAQERRVPVDEWSHLAYCPNCGAKLQLLKCKARCQRCGFFQDCSDTIV